MRWYNDGILWKVKEIGMKTENCADVLGVLSYRLSSASNDFIILEKVKDTFEENALI